MLRFSLIPSNHSAAFSNLPKLHNIDKEIQAISIVNTLLVYWGFVLWLFRLSAKVVGLIWALVVGYALFSLKRRSGGKVSLLIIWDHFPFLGWLAGYWLASSPDKTCPVLHQMRLPCIIIASRPLFIHWLVLIYCTWPNTPPKMQILWTSVQ